MDITLHAVGGYEEVGRNMTCLEIGKEAVILDMGIYLDRYVPLQDNLDQLSVQKLIHEDAIPDPHPIGKLRKKVKAIILSHAHLDHIGAVRWLASYYKCPILTTPYATEILRNMDEGSSIMESNKVVSISPNSSYRVSDTIEVEFILATHSIIQAAMVNIILPQGNILYSLDYKFDNQPIIGQSTNKRRLRQLGKENTIALIVDSTNAEQETKTYSESVAREMLRDVLLGMETKGHGIVVTTFSSHTARQKSIYDVARELGREVVFVGRSLYNYISAAEKLDFVKFSGNATIIPSAVRSSKQLKKLHENRDKYVVVATGSQGEPKATLSRIADEEVPFTIVPEDFVVFACGVIPTPTIQGNRKILEHKIHRQQGRIFKDIHVSGHASREDIRDLIKIVTPQTIVPAHGDMPKLASVAALAAEMDYRLGKEVHLLQNGQSVLIDSV